MTSARELGHEWHFNRVAIITGVGRSGTSILAKLIGSMENTFLLYEPAILKFMLHHPKNDKLTRSILMEDYFIPMIIGRNVNPRPMDESWSGNFWRYPGVDINNRQDAIQYIEYHRPTFVIKSLETQPLIPRMQELFPGCKIIHAVRHGNSVIGSTLAKGWYTDSWLKGSVIDYVVGHINCKIPWYLPEAVRDFWIKADVITRIAIVWAYLIRCPQQTGLIVRYEDIATMPIKMIESVANFLNIIPTGLTYSHGAAIRRYPGTRYRDFRQEISKPAYRYYVNTLNMLNYG